MSGCVSSGVFVLTCSLDDYGRCGPEDGLCRPKHVTPLNLNKLNKLDVLDVKCLSFNIELQHIGMSSIKKLYKKIKLVVKKE